MNAKDILMAREVLAGVPDTDKVMVIYAKGEDGDAGFRFYGLSEQAAALILRNVADALDAEEVAEYGPLN